MSEQTLERMIYSEAGSKIIGALELESINASESFKANLLNFLSTICTYEEEEKKVLPNIIVGNNIEEVIITIPSITNIQIGKEELQGVKMLKFLKAIIPFCNNGWLVYINIKDSLIEYGILRAFNGLKSVTLTDLLFDEGSEVENGLLFFTVLGKSEIYLRGLKQVPQIIDLRFIQHSTGNHDNAIETLSEDITQNVDEKYKDDVKEMYRKVLRQTLQKVHGTICVVVEEGTIISELEIFKDDGLILNQPLDIANLAILAIQENNSTFTEKYYAISGLLLEMMNIDGLTIIDTKGRIIAFNVFVNSRQTGLRENTQGGARTRAYQAVIQSDIQQIVGAYFQSQDGHAKYERRSA